MNDTLTTQEYADQVGVSRRTVQRWVQQGLIFAVKVGREFLIPYDEQPPSFFQQQDLINSDVQPLPAILAPGAAGFPTEDVIRNFEPEDSSFPGEEEEEEDEEDCKDAGDFDTADLRKSFSTEAEAESYAGDIPVPTEVFKRCSDGFFQVAIVY